MSQGIYIYTHTTNGRLVPTKNWLQPHTFMSKNYLNLCLTKRHTNRKIQILSIGCPWVGFIDLEKICIFSYSKTYFYKHPLKMIVFSKRCKSKEVFNPKIRTFISLHCTCPWQCGHMALNCNFVIGLSVFMVVYRHNTLDAWVLDSQRTISQLWDTEWTASL